MDIETNNIFLPEKELVEKYLRDSAVLISETDCEGGRLLFWKNANSLPTIKACSFTNAKGEISVPNCNEALFQSIFSEIRPELSNITGICDLIKVMSPGLRNVIIQLQPYMNSVASIWHAPSYVDGCFETFVENLTSGVIEKIILDEQYHFNLEVVGQGIKFGLR